jgi:hypothetical protein
MHHLPRTLVALLAVAAVSSAVAGCGGSSAPAQTPTAAPGLTPAPSATAAAIDPCLVASWTVVGQTQSSPANDENITYTGGAGEVFTIGATGDVTIDTQAAAPLVLVSAGETFKGTVSGTGRGTLTTLSSGPNRYFHFEPSAEDTRKTLSVDATGAELGPARPDTAFSATYTCAPGRFTFYKSAVNYMVDGPIVTLTSTKRASSSPTTTVKPS